MERQVRWVVSPVKPNAQTCAPFSLPVHHQQIWHDHASVHPTHQQSKCCCFCSCFRQRFVCWKFRRVWAESFRCRLSLWLLTMVSRVDEDGALLLSVQSTISCFWCSVRWGGGSVLLMQLLTVSLSFGVVSPSWWCAWWWDDANRNVISIADHAPALSSSPSREMARTSRERRTGTMMMSLMHHQPRQNGHKCRQNERDKAAISLPLSHTQFWIPAKHINGHRPHCIVTPGLSLFLQFFFGFCHVIPLLRFCHFCSHLGTKLQDPGTKGLWIRFRLGSP